MREEETLMHFYSLGIQYHVAARFAAQAGLNPVSGNLFHHAIEMYLKGHISRTMERSDLKKSFGHRLQPTWTRFKACIGDETLGDFDAQITELDRYERIRYPDAILAEGMHAVISLRWTPELDGLPAVPRPEPWYGLVVEDVERLVGAIFRCTEVDPAFFTGTLNREARRCLERDPKSSLLR